jgi:hypothetical protein
MITNASLICSALFASNHETCIFACMFPALLLGMRVFKPGLHALTDPRRHADLTARTVKDKRDSKLTARREPAASDGIELEFTPDEAKVMARDVVDVLFNRDRPLLDGPVLELALIRLSRLCLNQSFSNLADQGVQKSDIVARVVQCWQLYPIELAKESLNCLDYLGCRAPATYELAVNTAPLMALMIQTLATGLDAVAAHVIHIVAMWLAPHRSTNGQPIRPALFSNDALMNAVFSRWERDLQAGAAASQAMYEVTYLALQFIRPDSKSLVPSMDQIVATAWPMCIRTLSTLGGAAASGQASGQVFGRGEEGGSPIENSIWDLIACIKYMGARGSRGASLVLESPVAMQTLLRTLSPNQSKDGPTASIGSCWPAGPEPVLDALYACGAIASGAPVQLLRHPVAGDLFKVLVHWAICPHSKLRQEAFNVFIYVLSSTFLECVDLFAKLELFHIAVYRIQNQSMDSALTAKDVDQAVDFLSIPIWHMEDMGQEAGLTEHLARFLRIVPTLLSTCFIAVAEAGTHVDRCSVALSTLVRLWPHVPKADWYQQMTAVSEFYDTLQDLAFDDSHPGISANASLLLDAMNPQEVSKSTMDLTGDDSGMYYSF